MDYFWYYRPDDDFPPDDVLRPDDWKPSDRLCLSCTQTDLPAAEQRRIVRDWCDLLPKLEGLRFLWLNSRTPQSLFDAACEVPGLNGLWVKWSGVKSIESLSRATDLRYFHLGSSAQLESIEPLRQRDQLLWLGLENIKKISDLDPLGTLSALVGLAVEGSTWTTQRVDTLDPLGKLTGLRYLSIVNLRTDANSLEALYPLSKLESLLLALWWPEDQVAEIRRRNPRLANR